MEIPLHHLPPGGRQFEETWPQLTIEEESGLRGLRAVAVTVTARADAKRLRLQGQAEAEALLVCGRCLAEFELPLTAEIDCTYALTREFLERDADVARRVEGDYVDPQPEIVGLLLAELPYQTICQADCKGLCPTCGSDLNEGPCHCPSASGSPFEILKTLRTKQGDLPCK